MTKIKTPLIITLLLIILLFFGYRNYQTIEKSNEIIGKENINIIDIINNEKTQKLNVASNNIEFSVLKTNEILNEKFSIDIRLKKEYKKSEIENFAYFIKNNYLKKSYKRIFITYYMPNMNVGEGAWATSHFNPNLEIIMTSPYFDDSLIIEKIDLSKAQIAINEFYKKKATFKIIGNWYEGENYITFIILKNQVYFKNAININNLQIGKNDELIAKNKNGKMTFILKDILYPKNLNGVKLINEYTDYYLIEPNGNLSLYDKVGILEQYNKIDKK